MRSPSNRCRLLVGFCSWKKPDYLKKCYEAVLEGLDPDKDKVCVVLNDGDEESCDFLVDNKVNFVRVSDNEGPLAIDYLKPFVEKSEYFLNTNDDMYLSNNYADDLIRVIDKYYPTTASVRMVERTAPDLNYVAETTINSILEILKEDFVVKCEGYRDTGPVLRVGYNHPICVKSLDFIKVGGYSGLWRPGFESGYARDDAFPMMLKNIVSSDYNFIVSDNSFCYHDISVSMNRLPPHIKSKSNQDSLVRDFGMNSSGIKRLIKYGSIVT